MIEKDKKIKKQWLYIFIATMVITFINITKGFITSFKTYVPTSEGLVVPFRVTIAVTLAFLCTYAYALYRCAYQNPGTKFLLVILIYTPFSFVGSFYITFQSNLSHGILGWVGYGAAIAFYIMNWKLLILNKRLKMS